MNSEPMGAAAEASPAEAGDRRHSSEVVPSAIFPGVVSPDAPSPTLRTLDDALALLAEIEQGALDVFARHGLPARQGLYRREATGTDWLLMESPSSPEARWREILERPPEAGYRYHSLADVGRAERPDVPEVQVAATTLDRSADLGRLLSAADGEEASPELLMFWSTVELMVVLFSARPGRSDSRSTGRRIVEWTLWRAEAQRIWQAEPGLSTRAVAKLIVQRLDLQESYHSVRRRLSGHRPVEPAGT